MANDGRIRAINAGLVDGTHPAQLAAIFYAPQGGVSQIINGCAGTGCNSIEETDDYNNRLERARSRLQDYGNSAAITCEVYNYYGNVANPTSCNIPSQGTGDDGNLLGQQVAQSFALKTLRLFLFIDGNIRRVLTTKLCATSYSVANAGGAYMPLSGMCAIKATHRLTGAVAAGSSK